MRQWAERIRTSDNGQAQTRSDYLDNLDIVLNRNGSPAEYDRNFFEGGSEEAARSTLGWDSASTQNNRTCSSPCS